MQNLLFLFLIVLTNSIFAQFKPKEAYTVYINYPDYSVKATVSNTDKKITAKESLTYNWYASNKVLQTKGGYEGKILDGPYTSFYLSNNLKEKGNFKMGLKNGEWISWYENGKIKEISNWKKGEKNGICKTFDADDHITCESCFKNNELHGTQTDYEDGKVTRQTKYKRGKEIIKKPKKEKVTVIPEKKLKDLQPKRTFKEKVKSLFKKKGSETDGIERKSTPDQKSRKSIREKFASFFKKKQQKDEAPDPKIVKKI